MYITLDTRSLHCAVVHGVLWRGAVPRVRRVVRTHVLCHRPRSLPLPEGEKIATMFAVHLVAVVIALFVSSSSGAPDKPNIMMVLTDDEDMLLGGASSGPLPRVANLFATKGATFSNHFVRSPLSPALDAPYHHCLPWGSFAELCCSSVPLPCFTRTSSGTSTHSLVSRAPRPSHHCRSTPQSVVPAGAKF